MKSKLLSVVLIAALLLTSAVCSYASGGNSKIHAGKDTATTSSEDQKSMKEKIRNENQNATMNSDAKEAIIKQKRERIRSQYTEEEMEAVNAAAEKIRKENPDAKVLGFDSIVSDDAEFKFDTPPVIKGGRTLVPVRAITEGFGAELAYDQEEQVVTITKGDTVIELALGSSTATVNGQEVQMDTNVNLVNNRTYVPLRFVLETFKLNVSWDEDSETIEISDGTEVETGETTSDSAVTTDTQTETTTDDAITVTE